MQGSLYKFRREQLGCNCCGMADGFMVKVCAGIPLAVLTLINADASRRTISPRISTSSRGGFTPALRAALFKRFQGLETKTAHSRTCARRVAVSGMKRRSPRRCRNALARVALHRARMAADAAIGWSAGKKRKMGTLSSPHLFFLGRRAGGSSERVPERRALVIAIKGRFDCRGRWNQ
jgi:hypothetical protein